MMVLPVPGGVAFLLPAVWSGTNRRATPGTRVQRDRRKSGGLGSTAPLLRPGAVFRARCPRIRGESFPGLRTSYVHSGQPRPRDWRLTMSDSGVVALMGACGATLLRPRGG